MKTKELKQECIKRLEILRLDSEIINDFKNNDKIHISKVSKEETDFITDDKVKCLVDLLESERTIKIYHIIKFEGKLYMLSVHSHNEVWKDERAELKRGFTSVISYNTANDKFITQDIGLQVENERIVKVVTWKATS